MSIYTFVTQTHLLHCIRSLRITLTTFGRSSIAHSLTTFGRSMGVCSRSGVLLFSEDLKKVALVFQRAGENYGVPKGRKEKGESDICCATREALEELGLKLEIPHTTKCVTIYNTTFYVMKSAVKNFRPLDWKEIKFAEWFDHKSIKKLPCNKKNCYVKYIQNHFISLTCGLS